MTGKAAAQDVIQDLNQMLTNASASTPIASQVEVPARTIRQVSRKPKATGSERWAGMVS